MGRINTNVQSLIAQRVLGQNQLGLSSSLERLSTGLRINSGKDDPAGLIASNNLGAEIAGKNAAVSNANRADQVVNIAAGGLTEVTGLLTQLQGLVTSSSSGSGIAESEKQANQLQIDSILQTIDRISTSTSFQGIKLLNGNFDFKTSSVNTGVSDYKINAAKFSGSMNVDVLVTASAQQGGLFLSFGASTINTGGSQFTIEVGGSAGIRQLTFSSSTSLNNIAAAINSFTSITGSKATVSGTGIRLDATDFGSANFSSVRVVKAGGLAPTNGGIYNLNSKNTALADTTSHTAFSAATNTITDKGTDVSATINGITATAVGKTARVSTDFLDVEVTLSDTQAKTLGAVGGSNHAFSITGGGASFQLGGNVDIAGKVSIGIQSVASSNLGTQALGYLNSLASGQGNNMVNGDTSQAQKIVSAALTQVSALSGRLGAFQSNTIGSTVRSLGVAVENSTAAQSVIRDADFATETAKLTRNQILVSASTNVLSLSNQSPQAVLQLLG
ncbi:MAG: flagellin [Phycisphaerales bacterium]|nr:flagellin [Planctomycetota bacterium]